MTVLACCAVAAPKIESQASQPSLAFTLTYGPFGSVGGSAITVAGDGSSYLTGATFPHEDFPVTPDAVQKNFTGMWIAKIDPAGTRLVWATYVGGVAPRIVLNITRQRITDPSAIGVDAEGNVYVAGATVTTDFPVVNAVIGGPRGRVNDAFLVKLNPQGSRILYSTYLGVTEGNVHARGLAVDAMGNAYVGLTDVQGRLPFETSDLSAPGRFGSLVLAKLNPAGGVVYATRFGDESTDGLGELAVDGSGAVHVIGRTLGKTFAATLDPSGSRFIYSTTISGTTGDTFGSSIATDTAGNAFVAGTTTSPDFPVRNAFQSVYGGEGDWFLTKLDPSGSIVFSTYLGGGGSEASFGRAGPQVLVDGAGQPSIAGFTSSRDFTAGADLERPDPPLYRSRDGGATWQPRAKGLMSDVNALAATTSGTRLLYAATADGVFRSADLGESWQEASGGLPAGQTGLGSNRTTCQIAVDPAHPGTVYAGAYSGTYKSNDFGQHWIQVEPTSFYSCPFPKALAVDGNGVVFIGSGEGIQRSANGGRTWEDVSTGLAKSGSGNYLAVRSIVFDPSQAGVIYAINDAGVLYGSTNGGSLWASIAVPFFSGGAVAAVIVPHGRPHRVYASGGIDLLQSDDDGKTWSIISSQAVGKMVVRPDQPDVLFARAQPLARSVDGGRTWTTLGKGVLPDGLTAFAIDPFDANTIFAGAPTIQAMPLLVGFEPRASRVRLATYLDRWAPQRLAQDVTGAYYVSTTVNHKPTLVKLRMP